ncbi:MAG: Asp23/Gls24 family envelope stress response protein [Negativicutes bacterium]|nr:Asp23/Gls24 family envelope stress response protein [Negativicutes bacterium]MBP8628899.1 Asp23/Gls24 family envelope stress response protein [Negativicutes bacterium]
MEVLALVGPSGTGKSHRALVVAHDYNVDAIIDDGILIMGTKIIAGKSAKREASRIQAVRRAIFMEDEHAMEVHQALLKVQPNRLLLLGTSENMVHKIAKALKVPAISKIIRIEDIASQAEIEKAQHCRLKEGKHIIPVPTIELKPHFSGYLIDPLDIFFKRSKNTRRKLGEKSIVRPIFSYYGKLIISDDAISAIVNKVAIDNGIAKTKHVRIRRDTEHNSEKGIDIKLDVILYYGEPFNELVYNTQEKIRTAIEYMTGMNVKKVDILVKSFIFDDRRK